MTRTMTRTGCAVLVVLALLLVACGGGDPGDQAGDGDRTASTTTTTETTTSTIQPTTTTARDGDDGRCSASELDAELTPAPDLPEPVATTRQQIAAAAVACDLDGLAEIATRGGEPFSYSFGDDGDPAGYWREQEEAGREPLRFLVEVLDRPHGVLTAGGTSRYAWPSAFTYETWDDVPDADREALKPLYDEADLAEFAAFGAYVGYRVVIDEAGTWTAFVAGD